MNLIESLTERFTTESEKVRASLEVVKRDLTESVPMQWENVKSALAVSATYIGVFGFLLAYSYARAYNTALVGNAPLTYGYLETFTGPAGTLLSTLLMVAPLLLLWVELSVALSGEARCALSDAYRGARSLKRQAREVHVRYAKAAPIVTAAAAKVRESDPSHGASSEEVAGCLARLESMAQRLSDSADSHWHTVDRLARMEPGTWIALRLANSARRNWIWAALIGAQVVTLAGFFIAALATSGETPIARETAGIAAYAFTILATGCFWMIANVASFTNGPGSRAARVAAARQGIYAVTAVFFAVTLLGRADGTYSRSHPSRLFDVATVTLLSGETLEGYLLPITNSTDTFLLPRRPINADVVRIPAARIGRTDTTLKATSPAE